MVADRYGGSVYGPPLMGNKVITYRVCDLCPDDTHAVEYGLRLSLDGWAWEFDVCEAHGASFREDMARIGRRGTVVKTPGERLRSTVEAPALAVVLDGAETPVQSLSEAAVERVPVADYADRWTFTDHARLRMSQRDISEWDALRCAQYPQRVESSKRYQDCRVHVRGEIRVVVNRHTSAIITVMNRADYEPSYNTKAGS